MIGRIFCTGRPERLIKTSLGLDDRVAASFGGSSATRLVSGEDDPTSAKKLDNRTSLRLFIPAGAEVSRPT